MKEAKIADYVLCPSNYVADTFIQYYKIPQRKIIVNPYGVDITRFNKLEKKDNVFRIIYVGNANIGKGIIYLLEAVKLLFEENNVPYECVLIGKVEIQFENELRKYEKYIKHIDKVDQSLLADYYSNSSVFVFPSLDDGFGVVIFEAMECGLPVIGTTNSGCSTIITDGDEGFIVPIRDSKAIFEKLKFLYENPSILKIMSEKAYKKAKEFTWDNYVERLIQLLPNYK
jgi:glycosyltransferase involved in cell wall biosynthesis